MGGISRGNRQKKKSISTTFHNIVVCTLCVSPGYLALTLSAGLITVRIEAFIGVTVARSTGWRSPPTPGTLMINPTRTQRHRVINTR